MNITQETNDYFSTTEESDFIKYTNNQFRNEDWSKDEVWRNLENKFKTTDPFKRVSKTFRVNWSKVFKRGWLLWK